MTLVKRALQPSKNSFFLLGAFGTGKSTWVRATFPDALVVDLLDSETEHSLSSNPEGLIEMIQKSGKRQVVIDEIQKIPKLLEVVRFLIEKEKQIQFILPVSNKDKMRKHGMNLLESIVSMCYMYPYLFSELDQDYELDKAVEFGLLPSIRNAQDPKDALENYINLYLNPKIQIEESGLKIKDFNRFLEVMCFYHGTTIDLSNIADEAHIKKKDAENCLTILEDLFMGFCLKEFTKKAQQELSSHSKFYFFDAGVYRSIWLKGFKVPIKEIIAPGIKGLVAQNLKAWCHYSEGSHQLYYWQTKDDQEVDFIIHGDSGTYAFEVKNSVNIGPADTKSLKMFQKDYPFAECFLLYRGDKIKNSNGIQCIPLDLFFKKLNPLKDSSIKPFLY